MASSRKLTAVEADTDGGPSFEERVVKVRGVEYRLRELSSEEYDKLYKQSEINDDLDAQLLLKLMLAKSLVEPALTGDQIAKLPFRVVRELSRECNELHFGDEKEDEDPKDA